MPDTAIPALPAFDSTWAFFSDPYRFISRHCRALNTDVFQTRLLLAPTLCLTGPRAAELFYDSSRFQRHGAAPEPLQATLFGKRAVQSLDGPAHTQRKALFMDVLDPAGVAGLAQHVGQQWPAALARWPHTGVPLYQATHDVLMRAVCAWAGVDLPQDQLRLRTRQMVALFDDAARGPFAHGYARWARKRLQAWLAAQIEQARLRHAAPIACPPLQQVARYRDTHGQLLDAGLAATELLNLLRPVVAVSVYIVFGVHAMQSHPHVPRPQLEPAGGVGLDFLNEVRRYYPFFPALMATVSDDFEWRGYRFARGTRTLLDLYGCNHDPRVWNDPDRFDPGRFRARTPTPYEFIPQGGADAAHGHRCPGEDTALAIMKISLDFLWAHTRCTPTSPDLGLDYRRLPALPRCGFMVEAQSP
ncbi:MAG TPA: cytochrome P450 [Bordetella sp.]|nr:cytochrome P450 [Bordetella sp.]